MAYPPLIAKLGAGCDVQRLRRRLRCMACGARNAIVQYHRDASDAGYPRAVGAGSG
jgi:hypothetical protein